MEAEKENLIQNENNEEILNLNVKNNNINNISKDNSNESKEDGKEDKDIKNKYNIII
jgi:hypothetical protein